MIAIAPIESEGCCQVKQYVTAWAFGTGLRVGLKPGEYRITGSDDVNGVRYLQLDGAYRCPAATCEEIRWQRINGTSPAIDAFQRI